ncbi:MAG: glutathionylspermidine synthase family protein [Verrucomicrobiota bacterium]
MVFHSIRIFERLRRNDWQARVEESGLTFHSSDGKPYWAEGRYISLSLAAAEVLEDAANELHQLCLHACDEIVSRGWWERLAIPAAAVPLIEESWHAAETSLYGRFDLAWNGTGPPKLLEYNADTPTSLLEAAVIQWQWLEDTAPHLDQLNSLHEALVNRWALFPEPVIHFACVWDAHEDRQTIAYLAETAAQAGKETVLLDMAEIGISSGGVFTDTEERRIERLFKLYPWEWMAGEEFFRHVPAHRSIFTEPIWKMLLSNKGILPILWELNPAHPLLLPAALDPAELTRAGISSCVSKPFFGREGENIRIHESGRTIAETPGVSTGSPVVHQQRVKLLHDRGKTTVWGAWMVGDTCHGLSAREDDGPITRNTSRFLAHVLDG